MPAKRDWTDDEIKLLRSLTAEGVGSIEAARHFGVSPQYLRLTRTRLGVAMPEALARHRNAYLKPPPEPIEETREQNWWPLPAGHPETWGAIIRGTVLDGLEYPGYGKIGSGQSPSALRWGG